MRKNRACLCKWSSLHKLFLSFALFGFAQSCFGTGYFGPSEFFASHQKAQDGSPEFYWALEVTRMAQEFRPAEKMEGKFVERPQADVEENRLPALTKATESADFDDWNSALKEGYIKPGDPDRATANHRQARDLIFNVTGDSPKPLPEEFNSEFADYHRGAFAFHRDGDHWDEARQAWEAILKRPASERQYRSVWAAFMLGKMAMKSEEYEDAITWFQKTRALAKEGYRDSLGMAADSFGWEGRCQWKLEHPEKAAPLFLTQLALGDESAIVSLKALIPDRTPVEGMLNYGPELEEREAWSEEQRAEEEKKTEQALRTAAKDPLLRRLVTLHILATETSPTWGDESRQKTSARCAHWLAAIKELKLQKVQDAEYLGWVAYAAANYQDAAHWLSLAQKDSPAACWLRSKLQLRAGKLPEAAKSMEQAWQSIANPQSYVRGKLPAPEQAAASHFEREYEGGFSFSESASGEFGLLRLSRGEFVQALDILFKGGLWTDAAYVAERVLKADELKAYVDQLPPAASSGTAEDSWRAKSTNPNLRWLLGRRFVREDRYADAGKYLPAPYNQLLETYTEALKKGADEKLPKDQRARALFTAAWLARYDGMELMGTEVAPDGFVTSGDFESTDIAQQRLHLKLSKEEMKRLEMNKIAPDVRYHYRVIATALSLKAARLLEDNHEELADVLNCAGDWARDRDEKLADRCYQMLEKRCPKTEIGKAAIAKHWFVGHDGPWSTEQEAAWKKLHEQLGLPAGS